MKARKKCSTCRHYEPSPIRGQGWCRNPLLRQPHERSLVGANELACDKRFYDYWEPIVPADVTGRRSSSGRQPGERQPGDGSNAAMRGVAGGRRTPTFRERLTERARYLQYALLTGAALALVGAIAFSGILTKSVESRPSPSPTPTSAPATATVTPAVTIPALVQASPPSSTPTSTATPTAPVFVVVANTGGDGVYLRRTPAMGDRIIAWPEGTVLEVVGPDTVSEGRTWKHVKDPKGNVGYVPLQYTKPR